MVQEVAEEPVAPVLDTTCRGIRLVSRDDRVALEYRGLIYNALYAQVAEESRVP